MLLVGIDVDLVLDCGDSLFLVSFIVMSITVVLF